MQKFKEAISQNFKLNSTKSPNFSKQNFKDGNRIEKENIPCIYNPSKEMNFESIENINSRSLNTQREFSKKFPKSIKS